MKRIVGLVVICIVLFVFIFQASAQAQTPVALSSGETVYVSVYSNVFSGPRGMEYQLSAMLSLRNTDPKYQITIVSVKYYDTEGKLVKDYIDQPVRLDRLDSTRYIITEGDKTGGSGANFIVVWKSENKVNAPIIESVMIGTHSGQGISFVSRGQVLKTEE